MEVRKSCDAEKMMLMNGQHLRTKAWASSLATEVRACCALAARDGRSVCVWVCRWRVLLHAEMELIQAADARLCVGVVQLNAMMQSSNVPIFATTLDGTLNFWNEKMVSVTGYSIAHAMGMQPGLVET
eukprot:845229-Rhodomonas_salina.4